MGAAAMLQTDLSAFYKMPYESNWRILHIDGFEPMHRCLGCAVKYHLDFETHSRVPLNFGPEVGDQTCDTLQVWTNVGKA
jgi:hypothetical protein